MQLMTEGVRFQKYRVTFSAIGCQGGNNLFSRTSKAPINNGGAFAPEGLQTPLMPREEEERERESDKWLTTGINMEILMQHAAISVMKPFTFTPL